MDWIEPIFSKEKIKTAGKTLISVDSNNEEYTNASIIFHNWRSAHACPMQIILDFLRKNAKRIDKKALVVQRLKRVPSILEKLKREKGMNLNRIEDIAGCRAVVKNIGDVYSLYNALKNSSTKHDLHRERDYISSPKESGYRGIHLVYRYNGSKTPFNGLAVEIQLRSKIQHSWATAVEVVGTFTQQALKASVGEKIWLDFFKYASAEFAKLENCPVDIRFNGVDTHNKLKDCVHTLSLNEKLAAFNVAVQSLSTERREGSAYFLLILDLGKRVINIRTFARDQLDKATEIYGEEEQNFKGDVNKDIVLVSASSLKALKKAYPNYFSDTEEFRKYINIILEKAKERNWLNRIRSIFFSCINKISGKEWGRFDFVDGTKKAAK